MKNFIILTATILVTAFVTAVLMIFFIVNYNQDMKACFFAKGMVSVVRQYKTDLGRLGFLELTQGDHEACRNINEELDYPTFEEMGGVVTEGVIL